MDDEATELRRLLKALREEHEALEQKHRRLEEALQRIRDGCAHPETVADETLEATPIINPKPEV